MTAEGYLFNSLLVELIESAPFEVNAVRHQTHACLNNTFERLFRRLLCPAAVDVQPVQLTASTSGQACQRDFSDIA